ncbi:MAG: hypothetical protein CVV37_01825 [Nitrospira bacterium HGW-Nitrospira-1]|nr:MAG: hypothetical protein CVV37_01825 [Nitrospira bacterium HGW-Nitrospira-1]
MMKKIGNRGFVKGVFLLFVLVAVVFAGISFGKPYYRYYKLGAFTKDFMKLDSGSIGEYGNTGGLRKNIMDNAAELNVPLSEKNLEIKIVNKFVYVKATWSETVDFWGYYQKKLDFVMEKDY